MLIVKLDHEHRIALIEPTGALDEKDFQAPDGCAPQLINIVQTPQNTLKITALENMPLPGFA